MQALHKDQDVIKFSILAICPYVFATIFHTHKWKWFFVLRVDTRLHGHIEWQKETTIINVESWEKSNWDEKW